MRCNKPRRLHVSAQFRRGFPVPCNQRNAVRVRLGDEVDFAPEFHCEHRGVGSPAGGDVAVAFPVELLRARIVPEMLRSIQKSVVRLGKKPFRIERGVAPFRVGTVGHFAVVVEYEIDADSAFARKVQQCIESRRRDEIVMTETVITIARRTPLNRICPCGHPDFDQIDSVFGTFADVHFIIRISAVGNILDADDAFSALVGIRVNVEPDRIIERAVFQFEEARIGFRDPDRAGFAGFGNADFAPRSGISRLFLSGFGQAQTDSVFSDLPGIKAEFPKRRAAQFRCFPGEMRPPQRIHAEKRRIGDRFFRAGSKDFKIRRDLVRIERIEIFFIETETGDDSLKPAARFGKVPVPNGRRRIPALAFKDRSFHGNTCGILPLAVNRNARGKDSGSEESAPCGGVPFREKFASRTVDADGKAGPDARFQRKFAVGLEPCAVFILDKNPCLQRMCASFRLYRNGEFF